MRRLVRIESTFYLGSTELIGFTTDAGASIRQVRGWHHRGIAKLNFALDPAKHYNFTVTYENGRSAPNFEYLNKLTGGIRIIQW